MKKLVTIAMMMVLGMSAFAYDFSAVCPSGQTLYYKVLNLSEQTVAVTYYEYYNAGWEQWETYYYGAPEEPSGDLIIPETVEYNDIQFTVTKIGANAFRYCNITSVVIPNSVTTIDWGAFHAYDYDEYSGLTGELILPENLQSIGNHAFRWNSRLTKVTIPNSVKVIGAGCFETCLNLSHLTIGEGVEEIGSAAFDDCRNLDTIVVDRTTPPTCQSSFFRVPKDIPVYVPVGSKVLYEQAEYWSAFTNFIEEETLAINENETNGLEIYPNPTKNVLYVETQNCGLLPDQTYHITNLLGQTVLLGHIYAEKQRIDIADLSKGLYFITIGKQTKKLVIE